MYCKKCGSELKEGQKFCLKCGAPAGESPKKKHTMRMVIILLIVVIAVIVAAALFISIKGEPTIDLNKYTVVSFSGCDQYGTAGAVIDCDAINKDYAKKVKVSTNASTWLLFRDLSVGDLLPYMVSVSVNPDQGLSNGDSITVSYNADDAELEAMLSCKIKYKTQTYTVEGLEEIQPIDVFEGVELDFTGTAPHGRAEIKTGGRFDQNFYNPYSWKAEPDSDLSNGDTVTLLFEVGDEQAFLEEYGGMPAKLSKEYTVSGLDSYITDMSQLSGEHMKALKKEAKDQIDAECAGYGFRYTVPNLLGVSGLTGSVEINPEYTLKRIYFLRAKESGGAGYTSVPVFVYSVSAKIFKYDNDNDLLTSGDFYVTVAFTDLVLEENGNLVGTATNRVDQYGSTDEAYTDWVTSNKDKYTITVYDENLQKTK